MKRIINLALLVIVASLSAVAVAGMPVKTSDLPKNARTFLTKYFAGDNVRKAEKDQGHRGMEFEVDLQSGAEIDFRENGDWKDVKASHGKTVPAGIVPAAIADYVAKKTQGAEHCGNLTQTWRL